MCHKTVISISIAIRVYTYVLILKTIIFSGLNFTMSSVA